MNQPNHPNDNLAAFFADAVGLRPLATVTRYKPGTPTPVESADAPLFADANDGAARLTCGNDCLRVEWAASAAPNAPDAVALTVRFTAETRCDEISVGMAFAAANWSRHNYVLIPGAAYNGNRFDARVTAYPPMFDQPGDVGRADLPTVITDVPRLTIGDGPSRLEILARDAVTPAIGWRDPERKRGAFLLTDENTTAGPVGLAITESGDPARSSATFAISAPGVRGPLRYDGNQIRTPSEDRGVTLAPGESVTLRVHVYAFPCDDLPALFARFARLRKDLSGDPTLALDPPFSAAWEIQEEKYNRENWQGVGRFDHDARAHPGGYYAVGCSKSQYDDFQPGWVGGAMNTYALLLRGGEESQTRARQTLDWLFAEGQAASGYFKGVGFRGDWYDDGFGKSPPGTDFHLVRKSADALYFLLKQFDLLEKRGETVPPAWRNGARRCADALVQTWETFGEWGQFVSERTGDVLIFNSAAAGIAPAALIFAARYFDEPRYQSVAETGARFLYERFTRQGVTTGGPGEILQCPDSESAYGLLESYIVLYEATTEQRDEWIEYAIHAAHQCASWHVSYDYAFPARSEFGKRGMRSAGSVLANVQNKHSAPGVCTLSGDSLWKLFRATGDLFFLTLLRETARNLTQYLSRADRPIFDLNGVPLPPGYMNERVNLSDWDNNIGGVLPGSCWCETSLMLTFAEVPGVYVQTDTGVCIALDHVHATLLAPPSPGGARVLRVRNPTGRAASVSVWSETSEEARTRRVGQNALANLPLVTIAPGETAEVGC